MNRSATLLALLFLAVAPVGAQGVAWNWDPSTNTLTVLGDESDNVISGTCTSGAFAVNEESTNAACNEIQHVRVDAGAGDDDVFWTLSGALEGIEINLQEGADHLSLGSGGLSIVQQAIIALGLGPSGEGDEVEIVTGDSDDDVTIGEADGQLSVTVEPLFDMIFEGSVHRLRVATGDGNDTVTSEPVGGLDEVPDQVEIELGAGNDAATLEGDSHSLGFAPFVFGGEGDDAISFGLTPNPDGTGFGRSSGEIDGGPGANELTVRGSDVVDHFYLRGHGDRLSPLLIFYHLGAVGVLELELRIRNIRRYLFLSFGGNDDIHAGSTNFPASASLHDLAHMPDEIVADAGEGDDAVDFSAAGLTAEDGVEIHLSGGPGDDVVTGSPGGTFFRENPGAFDLLKVPIIKDPEAFFAYILTGEHMFTTPGEHAKAHLLQEYFGGSGKRSDGTVDVVWLGPCCTGVTLDGIQEVQIPLGTIASEIFVDDLSGTSVERIVLEDHGSTADVLHLRGTAGNDTLTVTADKVASNGGEIAFSGIDELHIDGFPSFFEGEADGDDTFSTVAFADVAQSVDGGSDTDTLVVNSRGATATDTGTVVEVEGALPITYVAVEAVVVNTSTASEPVTQFLDGTHRLAVYPNPLRTGTDSRIELTVSVGQSVSVRVYDVLGREVACLHEGALGAAETHSFRVGGAWAAGIYFMTVRGEEFQEVHPVVVVD